MPMAPGDGRSCSGSTRRPARRWTTGRCSRGEVAMPRDDIPGGDGWTPDAGWAGPPGPNVREPPHSFELEQALLGGILLSNPGYWKVAEFLRPEHFADPLHGR